MRPDILNPLFAELTSLKGIGPGLAKPLGRLGLARIVDALFHLPSGVIERKTVEELDEADVGRMIIVTLTARDYRSSGSSRAPLRIEAFDAAGNHVRSSISGEPAAGRRNCSRWARRGACRAGSIALAMHCRSSIPTCRAVGRSPDRAARAGLSIERGAEQRADGRYGAPGARARARDRRVDRPGLIAREGWPAWRARWHVPCRARRTPRRETGWPMTRCSPGSSPGARAAIVRRGAGHPLRGDRRLRDVLKLPFAPTGAQRAAIARNRGRSGAGHADAAAAPGRCRIGQDARRADGAADRGRGGQTGRAACADRNPRAAAFRDAPGAC